MIFDIPYRYYVTGTKHGNARPNDYDVWETMPLEIREVSPDDAPLAISWDDRFPENMFLDRHARQEWGHHGDDGHAHTVYFEDSHWVALNAHLTRRAPAHMPHPPYTLADVARHLEENQENLLFRMNGFDRRARRMIDDTDNDGLSRFSHIKHSVREASRERLRQTIAQFIGVNGRVYQKCDEPRLWLLTGITHHDRTTCDSKYRVAAVRVTTDHSRKITGTEVTPGGRTYFGIDEIDEVMAYAREHNERCGTALAAEMTRINERRRPVIHLDHSVDMEANLVSRMVDATRVFLRAAKSSRIDALPNSTVYLLLDIEGYLGSLSDEVSISEFEDAVTSLRSELSNPTHALQKSAHNLDAVAVLLDSRVVDLSPGKPKRMPS